MVSRIILSFVFVVLSLTVHVNSQTCEYETCSSNSACGCLPMAQFDNMGICALLGVSCSRLSRCQLPDNTCEKPDHICVLHSQCDSNPVCYPMVMIDQRLCPPITPSNFTRPSTIIISNYSSELTTDDATFVRPWSSASGYYYEAIQVIVSTTGTYNLTSLSRMDTYGFLYNGTFNPSDTNENLIGQDDEAGENGQFKLTAFLQAGVPYTLVLSTYGTWETGPFSVVASGPDDVYFILINMSQTTMPMTEMTTMITSTFPDTAWPTGSSQNFVISDYIDELTNSSQKYPATDKNYQAIQIMVDTTGPYDLSSISEMDTYACLYRGDFNPSYPSSNQLLCNDDYATNQFKLSYYLEAGVRYTLVFTTYRPGVTGPYTVVGSGPDYVHFTPIDTSVDVQETSTETTPILMTSQYLIMSNYSSELTNYSGKYPSSNKYYEAIQIIVGTTGTYTFTSVENIDGFGYLYQPNFDPSNPSNNLIAQDDQSGGNNQFSFSAFLQAGVPYTLVFSTYQNGMTGPFSIVASGPDEVDFTPLDLQQTTSTTTSTSTTFSSIITSYYSDELTNSSEIDPRTNKYYQAIQIMVNTTGTYDLSSVSNIDTYACLYRGDFNPSYTTSNQLLCDDDAGGNNQFKLRYNLEAGVPYTLIFTTFSQGVTGPYTVVGSGPDYVDFTPIDISIDVPQTSTETTPILMTSQYFIMSNYSSELTNYSGKYPNSNKYYEAIQIIVGTTGTYTFTSVENIDGFGYLYQPSFDPSNPSNNLIAQDDQSGGNNQFSFSASLQAGVPYTLVFSTYQDGMTGPFSIVASGPDEVDFTPLDIQQTTSSTWTSTTPQTFVSSNYSSMLTINSETYSRGDNSTFDNETSTSSYYFEAIQVIVNTTGPYIFTSLSNMDTYGYLYQSNFYSFEPSINLITQDDDTGGNGQFKLSAFLEAGVPYTLVYTTFQQRITGSFSIVSYGPNEVDFTPISNA